MPFWNFYAFYRRQQSSFSKLELIQDAIRSRYQTSQALTYPMWRVIAQHRQHSASTTTTPAQSNCSCSFYSFILCFPLIRFVICRSFFYHFFLYHLRNEIMRLWRCGCDWNMNLVIAISNPTWVVFFKRRLRYVHFFFFCSCNVRAMWNCLIKHIYSSVQLHIDIFAVENHWSFSHNHRKRLEQDFLSFRLHLAVNLHINHCKKY